ncbi:hypothetical protein ABT160_01800 [Streptomyces sp. NPDC001941]|uniref:hypothetical protein n=1 Tax=Streptomyces sp. NPDC001941 TaxID=3154659 RepID=UPI0033169EA7
MDRNRPRGTRTAAASALALAALAGCSDPGGGPPDGAPPPLGPVPAVRTSADIPDLPLDAYLLTREQYQAFLLAQRTAVRRCMARYGFDYRALDAVLTPGEVPDPRPDKARYYFLVDDSAARKAGYHPPPRVRARDKTTDGPDTTPTEAERAVLAGRDAGRSVGGATVPRGGCQGEAEHALLGDGGRPDFLQVANERNQPRARADADDRLAKAFAAWSACMKESGHDYRDPAQANDDPRWRGGTAGPAEIATATADVACKRRTNLTGLWWALQSAYEKQYIERNAERMGAVRRTVDAVLRNSPALAGGGA